ncbi:MAG: ABC transporter ATP-binding protein [Clostridiales Family XIII bacterium]|jgi:branched-chain amino acid transport system ATP-binding protein|nr:ABC transporter ATP-binding protein [Clostridiales Family XIII bacterium]
MSELALSIRGLKIRYGAIEAVKGIDLDVPEGKVVALLGANGAGKTSVLRSVSGLTRAAEGVIRFAGREITHMDAEKITKLGVVQSPEGRQIFRDLTVEENMKTGAFTIKSKARVQENFARCYRYFPRLEERKTQMSYTLSGGELQMLAIARALMAGPKLLLLDEPSLGLAPLVVRDIFSIIREIKAEGTTVLIVEQNALQTLKIADYGYVLETGKNSIHGPASELIKDTRLVEAYLGAV